jgi:hypothetical protein
MKIEVIPFSADSTGLICTANIPANSKYAVIGLIGPQAVAESYDITSLTSRGSSPLVGDTFRADAIINGGNSPAQFFPGPGRTDLGIPGAAWIVEEGANVVLTLTANDVAGGAPNDSEDKASLALLAIALPHDADLNSIPRALILGAAASYSVGTLYQETMTKQAVGIFANSRVTFLDLQARKTNLAANTVIEFGNSNFVSLSRQSGAELRFPVRGRINTRAAAGDSTNALSGVIAGTLNLEVMSGQMVVVDMLDTGDGVAAAKRADFVLFGYETKI